ncbi:Hsp70 family protein [Nocardia donostiensis]|uniref:Molecular chaperone n=1 Tax=Nocardia donostiensis TaxID=1538463 RepID=A0A1V2TGC1_9NOCA|nr:Hsp70 family protein [Nocardia donostiensis]ONM48557.1 hypothetical protein B0T46_10870 [Nocardia donostiensis]OQS16748.1 hypothetical protein B0T36_03555 [Nocardia donostiensis]OQS23211.1 hypothetical protein B0T44_02870 [Nocardia donostiensis]
MAVGLGLSIGTVNTVSAVAEEGSVKVPTGRGRRGGQWPAATHRTTLMFDSTGLARLGAIPAHGRVVTEFADITQRAARGARIGNRELSPADLVAVVADCLIAEASHDPRTAGAGITLTHPVGYDDEHLAALRRALDDSGLGRVELVAEPIAAAAWMEDEHGPLPPGLTLVYDLGGSSLDVTLVRVGAGRPENPVIGTPLRSLEYGGRAFGAMVVEHARRGCGADGIDVVSRASDDALRIDHVRASLEVVYRCLKLADVTMADVDRILVVGGAARPADVARVLAEELARPVVTAVNPERTIAAGAAILARRKLVRDEPEVRRRGGVRILSRSTKRRLSRAAVLTGSTAAVALAYAVPTDTVLAGLSQLGLG